MRASLFSVSYAGYWGQAQLSLEDFVVHAAKLGYKAVMLAGKRPHASPLDMSPARLAGLKKLLARHKLTCNALAAYTDFSPPRGAGIPSTEMQVAYVESMAKMAKSLGCGIVRVFTAYEHQPGGIKELWEEVVRALQECADRAAAQGVTLAVQNHHDLGLDTAALLELLADVDRPNCKLSFDAWSLALRGEDLYAAAKAAAPHAVMTTNADYIRLPRWTYQPHLTNYVRQEPDLVRAVPFGRGFIDYEAFFRGLREGGFDGWANYEMCDRLRGGGGKANLDRCARQYLEYFLKLPGASR